MITTVGPYLRYGEPLVAACADAGTDYVDLTGEPSSSTACTSPTTTTAKRPAPGSSTPAASTRSPTTSARTSPCSSCPDDVPITLRGVVRAGAMISGGTFHSAMTAFSRVRHAARADAARREERAAARGPPLPRGRRASRTATACSADWLLPLPTIDPMIVARSGAALPAYGPDFRYSHYAGTKTLRYAVGGAAGGGALGVAAQVPPLREALMSHQAG